MSVLCLAASWLERHSHCIQLAGECPVHGWINAGEMVTPCTGECPMYKMYGCIKSGEMVSLPSGVQLSIYVQLHPGWRDRDTMYR